MLTLQVSGVSWGDASTVSGTRQHVTYLQDHPRVGVAGGGDWNAEFEGVTEDGESEYKAGSAILQIKTFVCWTPTDTRGKMDVRCPARADLQRGMANKSGDTRETTRQMAAANKMATLQTLCKFPFPLTQVAFAIRPYQPTRRWRTTFIFSRIRRGTSTVDCPSAIARLYTL